MKQEIFKHITIQPNVRFGKPIIAGTRVPVDLVVGKVAGGMTIEKVMQEYDLTKIQVQSALKYAAHLVEEETLAFA